MDNIYCILDFVGNYAEALIALAALGLAIWQGKSQRSHNRLSVKPHLVFDKIVHNEEPQLQILLSNTGTGPAIITKFEVYLDGKKSVSSPNSIWSDIGMQLKIPAKSGGGKAFHVGDAIKVGGKEQLFLLTTNYNGDPLLFNECAHKELDRIQVKIEYESVYGSAFNIGFNET